MSDLFAFQLGAPGGPQPTWWTSKAPAENLTWSESVTPYVLSTEIIAQVEASIAPCGAGELSIAAVGVSGQTISLTLINGQPGRIYTVKFVITMTDGSVYQPSAAIAVRRLLLTDQPVAPPVPGFGVPAIWPPYYSGLSTDGVAVTVINTTGWPTSATDLLPGAVWINGVVVNAVLSVVPVPSQPLFVGSVRSTDLLALGAAGLPQFDPQVMGQLWLNGAAVAASVGSYTGLAANGTALVAVNNTGWPTSPEGLPVGAVWLNGSSGSVNIVTGASPVGVAPVFVGFLTATELLGYGGSILPTTDPVVAGQLWVNGVQIAISTGA